MKYAEVKRGRTFILRLEDGDILHESLEDFALTNGVRAASVIAVGAADDGSTLITGPKVGRPRAGSNHSIEPMELSLQGVHEITGTGTIFPDKDGNPILHMHIACGRNDSTVTGCIRQGVKVWHVMEVIIQELTDTEAKRLTDTGTGFDLLVP